MIELEGLEAKIKEVRRHLLEAKSLKDEGAKALAVVWENAPEDKRRDIEEARNRFANMSVELIHIERFLKEIIV